MAGKAAIAKVKKQKRLLKQGSKRVKPVRIVNRCSLCGRPRSYIRRFKLCRLCFRKLALKGELPGVKKISW